MKKLTKAILRPIRAPVRGGGGQASSSVSAAAGKKRGCRFENPEPSSPKVTCIGQVRVKSKRSRAKQRPIGEISFRKTEHIGDQKGVPHRWVHLPISIVCDALRSCAVEFSCLFPCSRKGCFPSAGKNADENGCGAVLGRWLVSVNCGGGGGGKRKEIEVVVGGGDTEVIHETIIAAAAAAKGEEEEQEEITSRVSICITQENAVLLMRCRSDPTTMAAALTAEYENHEEEIKTQDHGEENADFEQVRGFGEVKENEEEANMSSFEDSDESNMSSFEALLNQENTETHEKSVDGDEVISDDKDVTTIFEKEEQEAENSHQELMVVVKKEEKVLPECLLLMMCEPKLSMEVSKETWVCSTDFVRRLPERPLNGGGCCHHGAVKRRQSLVVESKPAKPSVPAPPPARKNNDGLQPARSSCSLPAAASMAAVIEQKLLANGGRAAYEPFALTRCKSEPMRTAAAKVMPESCLWKNGGLEPARLGLGSELS